jgi:DNA-binding response OmpR family regulator
VPRYNRPFTGRSTDPGRARRRSVRGGTLAIRGYSRSRITWHQTPAGEPKSRADMSDSSTILLVDDEDSVQKLLAYPLEREGYRVLQARDGEEALARFAEEDVDLVVLDLMLPKLDGLEVCKRLRAESQVPIIMLTARDDELDKVVGLELGADDYITKPFSIREFRSRIRALLRRAAVSRPTGAGDVIVADGLKIDLSRRSVEVRSRPVTLTYVEFELLRTLAAHPGRVYSRRMLLESLWGAADYREPRTIDVHVRHLREKLEVDPAEPEFILTVRGVGYRFRDR